MSMHTYSSPCGVDAVVHITAQCRTYNQIHSKTEKKKSNVDPTHTASYKYWLQASCEGCIKMILLHPSSCLSVHLLVDIIALSMLTSAVSNQLNSLAPARCSSNFRDRVSFFIFKLIVQSTRSCSHCEIALKCMLQNFTHENIGSANGFVSSGIKPLSESMLIQTSSVTRPLKVK